MFKNILVVIDMQPFFQASRSRLLIKEHVSQIRAAISNQEHIIVLEYKDCGSTHKPILNALKSYDKVKFFAKDYCSGSSLITKHLTRKNIWPKEIKFMGVNTGACVEETVINFVKHVNKNYKQTKVKVIKNGCRCDEYGEKPTNGDFNRMECHGAIII